MASADLKVAGLKMNKKMDHYLEDIMSNCFQRREKVRKSGYARKVLDSWQKDSYELESPWSSRRLPTIKKEQDEWVVGTHQDLVNQRFYRSKMTDMWTASYNNELNEVTLYIESGADPNARSKFVANRETPLHDAVLGGHLQMIYMLVRANGADINAQDDSGNTPLHLAVRYGQEEAVHVLLDQGANPLIKNSACHTPYQIAKMAAETSTDPDKKAAWQSIMEIKELANWDNEYHMVRMRTGIKAKLLLSKVRRHGGSDTPNKFFNKTVTQAKMKSADKRQSRRNRNDKS